MELQMTCCYIGLVGVIKDAVMVPQMVSYVDFSKVEKSAGQKAPRMAAY